MIKKYLAKLRKKRREIDIKIFWPACKRSAKDISRARAAFAFHAMNDNAWTTDMHDAEIIAFVERLDA